MVIGSALYIFTKLPCVLGSLVILLLQILSPCVVYNYLFEIIAPIIQVCTIPLDTAKVRLQLQKQPVIGDVIALPKYRGMLGTVATIAREEGLSALWKGIVPGLQRQCVNGGLRIALYDPVSLEPCIGECSFVCSSFPLFANVI